jgi:hypothetical protein
MSVNTTIVLLHHRHKRLDVVCFILVEESILLSNVVMKMGYISSEVVLIVSR